MSDLTRRRMDASTMLMKFSQLGLEELDAS